MRNVPAKQRLLARINRLGPTDCWPWTGIIGTWGYGVFWLRGHNINASRATYLLLVAAVPKNLVVCHTCDNPACCNPAHLWVGTQADNLRDCRIKGRAKNVRGKDHPRTLAKLSPRLIEKAKKLHYEKGISQSEIGRRWGVHSSVISRAVRNKTWKYLYEDLAP